MADDTTYGSSANGSGLKGLVWSANSLATSLGKWTAFLAPLLTRLALGYAFYLTGKGKIDDPTNFTSLLTDNNIPFVKLNVFFISHLECYGGILLILGLFTRPIAALLGSTMLVAIMTVHTKQISDAWHGIGNDGLIDITPVFYGLFTLWLLSYGPGMVSLDAGIRKLLEKAGWIAPSPCSK